MVCRGIDDWELLFAIKYVLSSLKARGKLALRVMFHEAKEKKKKSCSEHFALGKTEAR